MNESAGGDWGLRKERWTTLQFLNERRAGRAFHRREALAHHRPVEVYLQVTSGCNLDCYMCSEHNRPPEARRGVGLRSLSAEVFAKIEAQLFPYSHSVTIGVGGEPMLSPRFLEYVRRAHAANQAVRVMSNGTRLSSTEVVEGIVRHVTRLRISIDGATAETYERIRLGARWAGLMENLERLRRARETAVDPELRSLSFCFVLMRSNYHELPAFIRLAARMGADRVRAQSVIPVTSAGADEVLNNDAELLEVLSEARAVGIREGVELDLPVPVQPVTGALASVPGVPCHLPTLALFVNHEGVVAPCPHPVANAAWSMGDLRNQDFESIWNSPLYRKLRAGLARGPVSPVCERCSIANREQVSEEEACSRGGAAVDLATFYAGRDLAPVEGPSVARPPGGLLRTATELADRITRSPRRREQLGALLDRVDHRARRGRSGS